MDNKTVQYEENHLLETRKSIKDNLELNKESVNTREDDIYEINNYLWKNLTSQNSDIDPIEQKFLENEALDKHNVVLKDVDKITALKRAYHSAYFGRIDFNNEPIYIGITSVEDKDNFYVYDWRAPICSLFYNYSSIGKCFYETPEGNVKGELNLKRQYKIEDDKIVRFFDSSLNIDDEYLQEILVASKDKKMTNIVNTIQSDQNKIIRNTKDNILIVEGVAGSGKTSVALHHIAYLLYANKHLNSNNVLILSPNNTFSKYISNVLPELGERNVLNTTFTNLITEYLPEFKGIENYPEYLERIYNSDYDENIKIKQSEDIIKYLDEFIKDYLNTIEFEHGFAYKKHTFGKNQLTNYIKNKCNNMNLINKYEKLYERLNGFLNLKKEKEIKAVKDLLISISNKSLDIVKIYNEFIDYLNNKTNNKFEHIDNEYLSYEDSILALYLKFELFNYPQDLNIKHIVIDEAQDYSLLQYKIINNTFYKSNYTIVGDINQTINIYNKYNSLKDINKIFSNSKYVTLDKTYRSSKEIIDFTNKILNINNVCTVQKERNIPVVVKKTSKPYNELLKDLKELKGKSVGVITIDKESSSKLFDMLEKDNISCSLYDDAYSDYNDVIIIPSYMSKGLEFENVIIYNEKENYKDKDYLYYVVCTRAQSRLIIYNA